MSEDHIIKKYQNHLYTGTAVQMKYNGNIQCNSFAPHLFCELSGSRRGRDRMVVEFTTTCGISANYH